MQLLVIRHAIAEEREEFATTGASDDERPLTAFGRRRMRRNADGLRRIAPAITLLASSPLVRAQQTAAIVADRFGLDGFETVDALRPGSPPKALAAWLAKQDQEGTVAVVGHEPHLGTLVTWLLSGLEEGRVTMRKGGTALLTLDGKPGAGRATLSWLLTPSQLRSLGE
jgi:phosphohistidine phosphatase